MPETEDISTIKDVDLDIQSYPEPTATAMALSAFSRDQTTHHIRRTRRFRFLWGLFKKILTG